MTKQEAIETIKLALSQVEWDYPLDYAAAFDMAISAMEKQDVPDTNVGDMISRQNAIDAICKACSMEGDYHKCDGYPETSTWCDELVALRALPSAQPERQWIPCTDPTKLPKNKELWITCEICGCRVLKEIYWDMTEWSDDVSGLIAYMPYVKPAPYREEGEE